jgi:hypothetical protein
VARPRYPKHSGPLPPPLPPETRTVGQLVAETIRLYGERFWPSLALGLPIAVLDELSLGRSLNQQTLVIWICTPLLTAGYVGASALAGRTRPSPRVAFTALAVGIAIFLPVPVLLRVFVLPGFAWLALFGLAVPAIVVERLGASEGLRRGGRLGRVDYVHALGSLATLGIVYFLTRSVLLFLLRSQSDIAIRSAGFLADLVLSPIVFLGSALLYFDQAARVRSSRK